MPSPPTAAELEDGIREAVWSVARSSFTALRENLRRTRLSPPQYWVLQMVDSAETLSPSEISQQLGVRLPTSTGLLDLLVKQGWVERTTSVVDRRRVMVRLTPRGLRTVREIRGRLRATWHRRLGAMPARRQAEILAALTELESRIESEPSRRELCQYAGRRGAPPSGAAGSRRVGR